MSDPKLIKNIVPVTDLLSIVSLNIKSDKDEFDIISFYLIVYKKYYLSKILQTPIYFQSFNIQDIIPQELLSYMMYSVKSIK